MKCASPQLAKDLDVRFDNGEIYLNQELVTDSLRSEEAGAAASEVAALPAVRHALARCASALYGQPPGLVADGRDMGIGRISRRQAQNLPDSRRRRSRAKRRYKQLIEKGMDANMAALLQDIEERDGATAGARR